MDNLIKKNFKLRPSGYDFRDRIYKSGQQKIKETVDLRPWAGNIENQKDIGSCAGAAIVGAYELLLKKNFPNKFVDLSILYVYYHARLLEDAELIDQGVERLRNGLRGMNKFGICADSLWPYLTEKLYVQPGINCYNDAWIRKIVEYQSLYSISDMLDVLNNEIPVIAGMTVFDNFLNLDSKNSVVKEPKDSVNDYGGHAICLIGYDLQMKWFIAKNSYGAEWGDGGYCYIPFDYMDQFGFDKWFFTLPS